MRIIKSFYHILVDNKISTLSGSLCFFILLNGGSYLFLFSNIASMFIDVSPLIDNLLEEGLIKDILLYLLQYNASLKLSFILLIGSLYSSSSLYYHYMHACESITKIPFQQKLGKRLVSLILVPIVLIAIFILVIGLIILQSSNKTLFYLLIILAYILLVIFLNKLFFKNHSILRLIKGTIFTALYAIVFTLFFILYIKIFTNFKLVYGILSFIIVFLFYLYVMTIGLLIGIFINCKNLDVSNILSQA